MVYRIEPFRIAEGEQTPEACAASSADGWRVMSENPMLRAYYYRRKALARKALAALNGGITPEGGARFWPGATGFIR